MKPIFLCVTIFAIALTACADRANSSVSNSEMSAGLSTMEPAEPMSTDTRTGSADSGTAVQVNANSISDRAEGERKAGGHVLKQNISLAQTSASSINTAPSDRKIIRNAELNLEAENPEEAQQMITGIAELKGGFVVESQQSSSDNRATSRDIVAVTVRVPSDRFSEALDEIRKTATRVVTETVKGQDVTEEFIDIEAQMKARKALEEQFMAIMKRANSVEDALDVQRQLADVRGEIERIEGRKRFLENQSSLSTIKIRLQTAKVFAESSTGFGPRLSDAFSSGLEVAMGFVLGLVTLLVAAMPFAAFVGLPLFVFIRYVLRRQAGPKSVTEIAEEEIKRV
ncbi:MAG: DUF4349 domain-containing protein [Pyrinomonadaceae bacterium]